MRAFAAILTFELRQQGRTPLFAGVVALFFVIHLLTMASVGINITDNTLIDINSSYKVFQAELVLGFFGMLPAILFVVRSVAGDHERATAELFYATPVGKVAYLLGRFSAGFLLALTAACAGLLGAVAGTFMPWLDPGRIGPFDPVPYAVSFLSLDAGTLFVCCALFFSVAALTRSQPLTFGAALAVMVLELIVLAARPPVPAWLLLADPFGGLSVREASRYWTVSELNTRLPVTAWLVWNRLLWAGLGLLALAFTVWRFRLDLSHRERAAARRRPRPVGSAPALSPAGWTPSFTARDTFSSMWSQLRIDLRSVLLSPLLWLMLVLAVAATVSESLGLVSALMDLPLRPLTALMLGFFRFGLFQFVLAIVVFFSGQLVHREREHGLHEVVGASPHPDWITVVAKTGALCVVVALLLLVSMVASMAVQAAKGHYDFELGVYLQGLFIYNGFYFGMLCVLSILVQVMSPSKWSGMVLLCVLFAALLAMESLGLEHVLYGFRIPFVTYSDMNGFGHFRRPTFALIAYWSAGCALLMIVANLLYPRELESGIRYRLRAARARSSGRVVLTTAAVASAFVAVAVYIYFNTNVLNAYETAESRLHRAADYERRYGRHKAQPSPAFSDMALELDLYPKERRLESRGQATLRNNKGVPIDEFVVSAHPRLRVNELAVEHAAIGEQNAGEGFYLFRLERPLQPGDSLTIRWNMTRQNRGFVNSDPDNQIVANGTYVDLSSVVPIPSYDEEREVVDPAERRRLGLPPAPRLPALGDPAHLGTLGFGVDGRMDFRVVFSTSADQTAVAPGVLRREWTSNGRRYFEYVVERPIWPNVALGSARYTVARESWNGVAIEVYHDPKHSWNVPTMMKTARQSLEYFSREFGPYPLSHYRILEYPRYRGAAQASPGVIAYSESAGFLTDLTGWAALDYATIHELAHQWWGGKVYGAKMQGRQMLNETMAQYSTFMVLREYAEPWWLRGILASTLRNYLDGRSMEGVGEQPLVLTEDQGNISYNKGALAMFALQDLIGTERMHQGLRQFLDAFAFQPPPYPTSRDLVNALRAVAGPEHQALVTDLFEKIVVYDVQVVSADARAVDAGYDVTLTLSGRQFEADGQGNEREVPLSTWFDVAVFPESDEPLVSQTPIYQRKHLLHSGTQQVVVRVPARPGAAGVDPFHMMIDRNPDNNVLRLQPGN